VRHAIIGTYVLHEHTFPCQPWNNPFSGEGSLGPANLSPSEMARTALLTLLCLWLFTLGLVAAACSNGSDENKPYVATYTVNGTVRVITTGP
jgi:hypothetical protein